MLSKQLSKENSYYKRSRSCDNNIFVKKNIVLVFIVKRFSIKRRDLLIKRKLFYYIKMYT